MGGHLPSLAILSSNGLVFKRGLALDGAPAEALQDELEEFVNRKAEENPVEFILVGPPGFEPGTNRL
jgi:hypothetical protein